MTLNFIEVCAGAGGLSHGFITSGFTPILLNDNDKYCCQTLRLNHSGVEVYEGDMNNIDWSKYTNIDLVMGGVPCQSFSLAGKRNGITDNRGKLVLSFVSIINKLQPKVFLLENVKGLLIHNKGETLKYIINEFNKIGKYTISYKVLNANDYDVPQKRERLFIVGVRKDVGNKFEFPKQSTYKPILRDVLEDCPDSQGVQYSKAKYDLFKQIPEDGCWIDLPKDVQKSYLGKSYDSGGGKRGILKRLSMNKPSLTLLTTPSQKQTERCHPIHTRPLQTLEYARIQTFPDTYKFAGSVNQIYKQIGNAVPVNLAKAIAKRIIKVLE